MFIKHICAKRLALGVAFSLMIISPALAVEVEVDGTGGTTGKFAKLSEAVSYINGQGAGPHIINITTSNLVDDTYMTISQPVTINGGGESGATPCDIKLDIAALTGGGSVTDLNYYITINAPGQVILQDLKIHPDSAGLTAVPIGAIKAIDPAAGMGDYLLKNIDISGSVAATGEFVDPLTDADLYADLNNVLWYPAPGEDSNEGGTVLIDSDSAAAGDYDITLDHCRVAMAVSQPVHVDHRTKAGVTTILGGLFGHCSRSPVLVSHDSKNVFIRGSYEDRVKFLRGNHGSSGAYINVQDHSTVDLMQYVDAYLFFANCWGINLGNNATINMKYCRIWHGIDPEGPAATGGRMARTPSHAVINADSCTFFCDNTANMPTDNVNAIHSSFIDAGGGHDGLVTYTNCVFASDGPTATQPDGYFHIAGSGPYTFTNCALPQDDYVQENLNTAMFDPSGSNAVVTDSVSASPHFATITYDITDPSNPNFLLPTDPAYDSADTDGQKLVGGVGRPTVAGISDWMLMEN